MRTLPVIAILLMVSLTLHSQTLSKKEQRALYRQMKKEQKAEEAARQAKWVEIMVVNRRFVLEANQLRDHRGNLKNVSSMINFLAADSLRGVLQVGDNTHMGLNGVGGVTVEGEITNYKYHQHPKHKSFRINYILKTVGGTYDVRMSVSPNGRAEATIGSAWPGKLIYMGELILPGRSKVYKGTPF
jgi:hypothetical protein